MLCWTSFSEKLRLFWLPWLKVQLIKSHWNGSDLQSTIHHGQIRLLCIPCMKRIILKWSFEDVWTLCIKDELPYYEKIFFLTYASLRTWGKIFRSLKYLYNSHYNQGGLLHAGSRIFQSYYIQLPPVHSLSLFSLLFMLI